MQREKNIRGTWALYQRSLPVVEEIRFRGAVYKLAGTRSTEYTLVLDLVEDDTTEVEFTTDVHVGVLQILHDSENYARDIKHAVGKNGRHFYMFRIPAARDKQVLWALEKFLSEKMDLTHGNELAQRSEDEWFLFKTEDLPESRAPKALPPPPPPRTKKELQQDRGRMLESVDLEGHDDKQVTAPSGDPHRWPKQHLTF